MTQIFSDTRPEAEEVLFELLRAAPPWRKLRMMEQLNTSMRTLAIAGLRQRHPEANDSEIRRRLADILLGPQLALTIYGPVDHSPVSVSIKLIKEASDSR